MELMEAEALSAFKVRIMTDMEPPIASVASTASLLHTYS